MPVLTAAIVAAIATVGAITTYAGINALRDAYDEQRREREENVPHVCCECGYFREMGYKTADGSAKVDGCVALSITWPQRQKNANGDCEFWRKRS